MIRESQKRERKVTVHKENVYSCNLVGFKGKVNTLVGIKDNVKSLVPSLLIKLSQVLSPWMWSSLGRITLNFLVIIITLMP